MLTTQAPKRPTGVTLAKRFSPPLEYRYEPGAPHVSLVSPHEPAPVVRNDVYPFHLHTAGIITPLILTQHPADISGHTASSKTALQCTPAPYNPCDTRDITDLR